MAIDQTSNTSSTSQFNSDAMTDNETLSKSASHAGAGTESDIASSGVKASRPQSAARTQGQSSTSQDQKSTQPQQSAQTQQQGQQQSQHGQQMSGDNALDVLRGSVVGVLDSVVREYEPQIASFTSNIAHQAVDRGVEFAQTAVTRVKAQSWMRLGLAAALGIGIIAVLSYEAAQAAAEGTARTRKPLH